VYEFTKPTSASWITAGSGTGGGGTTTEGVNTPSVLWGLDPVCGQQSYVGVFHSESQQVPFTYTIHDSTGQIGTVTVGTNASLSNLFYFTVSSGLISVYASDGTLIGSKVFTCGRKGSLNFW